MRHAASPHPIIDDGVEWPTVLRAYWAASTSDPELIAGIRKFAQHPGLAARLVATGDSMLVGNTTTGSYFWDSRGQNWIGRLLELVRAELASAAGTTASAAGERNPVM